MHITPSKIVLFLLLVFLLSGCNATKRVPEGKLLLTENIININGEENKDSYIQDIPYLQPNIRTRLFLYNIARPNIDSILRSKKRKFWTAILSRKQIEKYIQEHIAFNQSLKEKGEKPAVIADGIVSKSADRLTEYYNKNGWFNAETSYEITADSSEQKGQVTYKIDTGEPYIIDSLKTFIKSPEVDSIYQNNKSESLIVSGKQYKNLDVNAEATRLNKLFRNNGVYYFDKEYISFIGDSVNTNHKLNLELNIDNRQIRTPDSVYRENLKVYTLSKVNVFTDYTYLDRNNTIKDRDTIDGYELMAYDKIDYKPRYLTDAIFIEPGDLYSDESRNQTLTRLSQLRTFRYPDLRFEEDPSDPEGKNLIASIYLTPLPRYNLRANFDLSTSNIKRFGIAGGTALTVRNVFGGLETLQLSTRASIGSSHDVNRAESFLNIFDITELGVDLNLNIPRIFFPINMSGIIKPEMSPATSFTAGLGAQQNIGLDKQNFTGGINYSWSPSSTLSYRYDLLDVQYVRNLNQENYFNIYGNSFDNLNNIALNNLDPTSPLFIESEDNLQLSIPQGAEQFINGVLNTNAFPVSTDEYNNVRSIEERRQRITQNNLIVASSFTYFKNSRVGLYDNAFSSFRAKLELAGNALDVLSSLANFKRDENGNSLISGVPFSQYVKTELDYIKHWDFGDDNVLAFRAFGGIAIPYGNSNSIPFIRSFYGGGSNDNRAYQAYRLGPGRTDSPNDFNEANMKLAFNLEQRFRIFGDLKGALFVDVGNIWNVLDIEDDPEATFVGFESLKDIAVGSGFGVRYDFSFFVLRFDLGFKTYNPALDVGRRWFTEYNFSNVVLNVGINYPF